MCFIISANSITSTALQEENPMETQEQNQMETQETPSMSLNTDSSQLQVEKGNSACTCIMCNFFVKFTKK